MKSRQLRVIPAAPSARAVARSEAVTRRHVTWDVKSTQGNGRIQCTIISSELCTRFTPSMDDEKIVCNENVRVSVTLQAVQQTNVAVDIFVSERRLLKQDVKLGLRNDQFFLQ